MGRQDKEITRLEILGDQGRRQNLGKVLFAAQGIGREFQLTMVKLKFLSGRRVQL